MKCERCGENEANLYIKQIYDGKTHEENICSECAEKEEYGILGDFGHSIKDFCLETIMSGLSDVEKNVTPEEEGFEIIRCPQCNSSYQEILKSGFFGCPECYNTFHEEVNNILKQINGTSVHRGKSPVRFQKSMDIQNKLKDKEMELQKAILEENYEYAAILRDEIKKIKSQEDMMSEQSLENEEAECDDLDGQEG